MDHMDNGEMTRKLLAVIIMWLMVIATKSPAVLGADTTDPGRHDSPWQSPMSDPNVNGTNDWNARVHNKGRLMVMSPWIDDGSWSVNRTSDGADMNDTQLISDTEYHFNLTVVDFTGFWDVERVRVHAWYDMGDDSTYFNYTQLNTTYPGTDYGNYHFILEYNNGTNDPVRCPSCVGDNTTVWKIWDATNGSEVTFLYGVETLATNASLPASVTGNEEYDLGDAYHLEFHFMVHSQFHRAGGDANGLTTPVGPSGDFWDPSTWWYQSYSWMFNDNGSWNYGYGAVDKTTYDKERPLGEFGMFAETSIAINDTTPVAFGDPGDSVTSTNFEINMSMNFEGNVSVTLEDNLYRTDWAAAVEWIGAENVSINGTELDKYGPGGSMDNGGNLTGMGNKSFANLGAPGAADNSTRTIIQYHDPADRRGPERHGYQVWNDTYFEIDIPPTTLGGSYQTGLVFLAEQWEWPSYPIYVP